MFVRHFPDHRSQESYIKGVVGEWKSLACLSGSEADITEAGPLERLPRLLEHLGLDVEQVESAGGEATSALDAEEARARSRFEHVFRHMPFTKK